MSLETPKIHIRGLRKAFGEKIVLDGLDLDVGVGESVVVIGGSGTGKSVLLKCILGLLHPDAGSIKVDGEEVVGLRGDDLDRVRRKFGMLFQNAALFDSMPVLENIRVIRKPNTDALTRPEMTSMGSRKAGNTRRMTARPFIVQPPTYSRW